MFRLGLVAVYFGYLMMAGTTMASGISHADKSNSQFLKNNVCLLVC